MIGKLTPKENHHTQTFWAVLLEYSDCRYTSYEKSNVEGPNRDVEPLANQVQLLLHALNFSVAKVRAVLQDEGTISESLK
jgi:hypothetical protein